MILHDAAQLAGASLIASNAIRIYEEKIKNKKGDVMGCFFSP
jgi:hypothetical protein